MISRITLRALSGIGLAAIAACGPSREHDPVTTVHDSSGVRLGQNRDAGGNGGRPWRLDSTPLLSIGSEEGPEAYRFDGISGVARLPGGRLAVADRSQTIRFFDSTGKLLKTTGREGDGPGEFRHISLLASFGTDSLLAWDFPQRRATILADSGALIRTTEAPSATGFFFPAGAFADGAMVGLASPPVDMKAVRPGPLTSEDLFLRLDWRTGDVDTLARATIGGSYVRPDEATIVSIPFAAEPVAAVAGSALYLCLGATYEIRKISEGGALQEIIRLDRAPRPLTKETIAANIEQMTASGDARRQEQIRRRYSDLPYPEALPACGSMIVDSEGNIWLGHYAIADGDPVAWTVFDPQGHVIGDMATPAAFEVLGIDSASMVGVASDSLGVERVQVLRLRKDD